MKYITDNGRCMNFLNTMSRQNNFISQTTINEKISFSGVGIHNGKAVNVSLLPAEVDTGIVFRRTDLDKNNEIKVNFNNIIESKFCSKIKNKNNVIISTLEHLMSTLNALSIDNLIVEIDSYELPAMDGSAYEYTYKISEVGKKSQNKPKKFLKINKEISVNLGKRWIKIVPSNELLINLEIDYPNTLIGKDTIHYLHNERSFVNDICYARTFTLLSNVEKLRASGFGIGGNLNNALVVDKYELVNETGLRAKNEFIKHKVLDCLGDFYLSGFQILGEIRSFSPGHELNFQLLKEIFKSESNFEITTKIDDQVEFFESHERLTSFNVA